jgi:hypothetical protein
MDHKTAVATMAAERYLLDEMNGDERDAFEEHVFDCAQCADDVRAGGIMRDGVRAGLITPREAASAARKLAWRPAIAIPWAAAAALAIVAGYESVHTRTTSNRAPLALAPVTLRPASRGDDPVVAAGPGGVVTLAVALSGAEGAVEYELRRRDVRVAVGEASAPIGGAPLLLMIPSGILNAGDRCILIVKNASSTGLTGEEYRFRVESR